jgi:SAM-dependent methyltransferase
MLTVDLHRLGVREGATALDLGCGGGRHAFALAREGAHVVALDASHDEVRGVLATLAAMVEAGELQQANCHSVVIKGDALTLPFSDETFDFVIAAEVLEHIPDDKKAISELARVLKSDGKIAVTVPRAFPEVVNWALTKRYHNVEGGHVRIYTRRNLTRRLHDAGFQVCAIRYQHGLHSPYWWLRCLVGVNKENNALVSAYHALLVKDIVKGPWYTKFADALLTPFIGKSMILYAERS